MRKLIVILAVAALAAAWATTASAAKPQSWGTLQTSIDKMVKVAYGGNCTGEPTNAMKDSFKALSETYKTTLKQLDDNSMTPRPVSVPSKPPSFDEARNFACYAQYAPKVALDSRWGWPYKAYLNIVKTARKWCSGEDNGLDYLRRGREYNLAHYHRDYPWPANLPASVPALKELAKAVCK